jgi:Aminoglycoside-2''-adenylyltransferase
VKPDTYAWEPWQPEVLAERLAGVDVPWCVAAGWAIDLFHGSQTRPHGDVEIAVPASRFADIAARLGEIDFHVVQSGTFAAVSADTLRGTHQTWGLDRAAGVWRVDVFREPHDGDTWIYRRDDRIRLPYRAVIRRTASDVPYQAPEIALLFKAKAPRPKDEADLRTVLPLLDNDQRRWLADALAVTYEDHPWRSFLLTDAG